MDPDVLNFLILATRGDVGAPVDLPGFWDEEEQEDDEEEEDEEEDEEEMEAEGSGTTLRQGVHQEVVNLETQDEMMEMDAPGTSSGQKLHESCATKIGGITEEESKGELNLSEIDGLNCPICYEAWTSGGDHHVCCLPCGHIYGLSCIKKWLRRPRSNKCPQCKKKCGTNDIRLLYTSRIVALDGELQRTIRALEGKCAILEKKNADWSKMEVEWKKKNADMRKQVHNLAERAQNLENKILDVEKRALRPSPTSSTCRQSSALDCDAYPQFYTQDA